MGTCGGAPNDWRVALLPGVQARDTLCSITAPPQRLQPKYYRLSKLRRGCDRAARQHRALGPPRRRARTLFVSDMAREAQKSARREKQNCYFAREAKDAGSRVV